MGCKFDPERRCKPITEWPAPDQQAWETALSPGDLLDVGGSRTNRAHPVDTQPYQIRYGVIEVTIAGQFDWNLL